MTPFRLILAGALLGSCLWASAATAAPEDPPKKRPGGSAYTNKQMGVAARGPAGWRMIADKAGAPSKWSRLVTFNDSMTDAQAVFSARPRTAGGLEDLLGMVRKDWDKTADRLRVSSMRKIDGAGSGALGTVVVDATFVRTRKAKTKPGSPPPPPQPPVTYRVQATYYLASGYEFLLYAQGQQTHWSRLRGPLSELRSSMKFVGGSESGPRGEGSYRDERRGFACRYPKDYTVVVPQRGNHFVQFEGLSGTAPVLGVYGFRWSESVVKDAERLIAFYEDTHSGEATMRTTEVGGNEAMFVTANANVGGVDRVILFAIFKRGDELFRVRASMPKDAEAGGARVFRKFVNGFKLISR